MVERKPRHKPAPARIEFPGTGISIPLPDDPNQEDEAVAAALAELVAAGKLKSRHQREPGIPAEALHQEFGYAPPAARRNGAVPKVPRTRQQREPVRPGAAGQSE